MQQQQGIIQVKSKRFLIIMVGLLAFSLAGKGQDFSSPSWLKPNKDLKFKPVFNLQLWSTYTYNTKHFDAASDQYVDASNRLNFLVRRTRAGFQIEPYDRLTLRFVAALDMVGRDLNSGFNGGSNNGSFPNPGLWDAYLQYQVFPEYEGMYVTLGYFVPSVGLASISSAFQFTSLSKSFSQAYVRQHLVGRNPGRTSGIAIGGLLGTEADTGGFQYELGIHNSIFPSDGGNTSDRLSSPLLTGRLQWFIGERSYNNYRRNAPLNDFAQRRGLTLAIAGSYQGATDIFEQAYSLGTDIIANYGHWHLYGEWYGLWRAGSDFTYLSQTGFISVGHNFTLSEKYVLEPALLVKRFLGADDLLGQAQAGAVGAFAGSDASIDFGINWYLNRHKLKIALHHTWETGNMGEAAPGATFNQFYYQKGLGAIQRGHWWGMGVNFVL